MLIKELQEGQHVAQVFFCKQKSEATAKNGKNYYSLKLQDRSGVLDAKVWDLNNGIEHFDSSDFIFCDGEVTSYLNQLQLTVKRIRRASDGEYDPAMYFPTSDYSREEMYQKLLKLIDSVKQTNLHALLVSFFKEDEDFIKKFKEHSAAKSIHHNFIGGLLEHTLRVAETCNFYATQYPLINRDLLLTAAIFHDIGKLKELSPFPTNDYTDEGQLIGHIVIGYEMISRRIDCQQNFPEKLKTELLHCILAHHGELEYGSPKLPALLEAQALAFADDTNAKLEIMIEEFEKTTTMDFLGFNKVLGVNIRRTTPGERE